MNDSEKPWQKTLLFMFYLRNLVVKRGDESWSQLMAVLTKDKYEEYFRHCIALELVKG